MSTIEHAVAPTEPYVSDSADPKRHFVMEGDVMTGVDFVWHATGDDTDGRLTICEATLPPGTEFLMHRHAREDEAFLVLEGELTLRDADRATDFVAGPGQMVWAPRGHKHTYAATAEVPTRAVVVMTPGSGLEEAFRSCSRTKLATEADLRTFADGLEKKHGVTLFPDEQTAGTARGY